MRLSIVEGLFTTVFIVWTSGSVLTGYLIHLKASPLEISLLASLPVLVQLFNPLALILLARWTSPRLLTTMTAGAGRLFWLLAIFAPFLFGDPQHAVTLILLVLGFSSLLQSFAGLFWTSWMADLVPEGRRGRYFGLRNGICALAGVAANLTGGLVLDKVEAPYSFQVLLSTAVIFAVAGVFIYTKQTESFVDFESLSRIRIKGMVRRVWGDRNFRRLCRFIIFWQLAVFLGAPFVYPYFIKYLGLSFTEIAIWTVISAVLTLAIGPFWGRLADRVGNKPILAINTVIAGGIVPACWLLAKPGDTTFIWLSAIFEAIAWSAINPAVFNLTLVSAPKNDRLSYLSLLGALAGASAFSGALLSGIIVEMCNDARWGILGIEWSGWHLVLFISAVARSFAWILLRPVKETNSWRVSSLLQHGFRRWRLTGFPWR